MKVDISFNVETGIKAASFIKEYVKVMMPEIGSVLKSLCLVSRVRRTGCCLSFEEEIFILVFNVKSLTKRT